jgi:hypothetical protein
MQARLKLVKAGNHLIQKQWLVLKFLSTMR